MDSFLVLFHHHGLELEIEIGYQRRERCRMLFLVHAAHTFEGVGQQEHDRAESTELGA
jgi:hypothetical protein